MTRGTSCSVLAVLVLAVVVWMQPDLDTLEVSFDWIHAFGDPVPRGRRWDRAQLLLLTAFVSLTAAIASWNIEKSPRGYHAMFLLLLTGMLGVFVSLDLFLFYVFWEIMLLPMYFLIGIWGGPRRKYAAIKFFLYTLFGSVLLLAAILARRAREHRRRRHPFWHDPRAHEDRRRRGAGAREADPRRRAASRIARVPRDVRRVRDQGARRSRSTRGCPTRTSRRRRRSP